MWLLQIQVSILVAFNFVLPMLCKKVCLLALALAFPHLASRACMNWRPNVHYDCITSPKWACEMSALYLSTCRLFIITGVILSMKQTGRVMIVSLVHKLFCYNLAFPSFCYRLACMCLKSSIFLVTGLALTTMGIVLAATTFPSPTVFAF